MFSWLQLQPWVSRLPLMLINSRRQFECALVALQD
jgi:hypothetical protein